MGFHAACQEQHWGAIAEATTGRSDAIALEAGECDAENGQRSGLSYSMLPMSERESRTSEGSHQVLCGVEGNAKLDPASAAALQS